MGRPEQDSNWPPTPAAVESEPRAQSPRVPPKAVSMLRPGFRSRRRCWKRAKCRHSGRQQSGRAQHAYQLWLSQPSSTWAGFGAAFLVTLGRPSPPPPQASPPSLLSLFLWLEGEPEPHTSQLSELRFSAEASAHVQLSLLGDLWAAAGSVLPKVSQKLWGRVLLWELSPPLFW